MIWAIGYAKYCADTLFVFKFKPSNIWDRQCVFGVSLGSHGYSVATGWLGHFFPPVGHFFYYRVSDIAATNDVFEVFGLAVFTHCAISKYMTDLWRSEKINSLHLSNDPIIQRGLQSSKRVSAKRLTEVCYLCLVIVIVKASSIVSAAVFRMLVASP